MSLQKISPPQPKIPTGEVFSVNPPWNEKHASSFLKIHGWKLEDGISFLFGVDFFFGNFQRGAHFWFPSNWHKSRPQQSADRSDHRGDEGADHPTHHLYKLPFLCGEKMIWAMKKGPLVGWVIYIGDEKLPNYMGIIINHYKDPY